MMIWYERDRVRSEEIGVLMDNANDESSSILLRLHIITSSITVLFTFLHLCWSSILTREYTHPLLENDDESFQHQHYSRPHAQPPVHGCLFASARVNTIIIIIILLRRGPATLLLESPSFFDPIVSLCQISISWRRQRQQYSHQDSGQTR